MSGHTFAVTRTVCPLCDGPCRDPIRPQGRPISSRVTQEQADAVNEQLDPSPPTPPSERRRGRRAHRPDEDRAHRPSEDR